MNLTQIKKRVRYVDGFLIRNTMDNNFTELHWHSVRTSSYYPKFYIPEGELWVDYRFKDEIDFLLTRDIYWFSIYKKEYNLKNLPKNSILHLFNKQSVKIPAKIETLYQERTFVRRVIGLEGPIPEFKKKVVRKGGVKVVYVIGKIVRQYIDSDFVFGGHHYIYAYIPKDEIWLDIKTDPKEQPYVLLHESTEREKMKKGKNYDYSHDVAMAEEMEAKREAGIASYPGDVRYIWYGKKDKEIIKHYYVSGK